MKIQSKYSNASFLFVPAILAAILASSAAAADTTNEYSPEEVIAGLVDLASYARPDVPSQDLIEVASAITNAIDETPRAKVNDGGRKMLRSRSAIETTTLPEYIVPQNPYMGPNPGASMHGDAWLSDTTNYPAPSNVDSTIVRELDIEGQCYTSAFNSQGDRLVLLCHTIPVLDCFQTDSECSLRTGTKLVLVERSQNSACWEDETCNVFNVMDSIPLSGKGRAAGIYFYIDNLDRAVVADSQSLVWFNVSSTTTKLNAEMSVDLSSYMVSDKDQVTSAFPGWDGTIWWESNAGKVGTIDPKNLSSIGVWEPPEGIDLTLCPGVDCPTGIVKGMSVDDTGVYIVSNSIVAKFISTAPGATPSIVWQYNYDRGAEMQPGMQSWGSGTSPKLFGSDGNYLAIADNANPQINIQVLNRQDGSVVCSLPIFHKGQSATTTSFVGYENTLFAVNDYGMEPGVSVPGAPGFIRVDVEDGTCKQVWSHSDNTNTGCLKLSTQTGLVYNNVNTKSLQLQKAVLAAKAFLSKEGKSNLIPLVDFMANFFTDNYVLARDFASGNANYKLPLNMGRTFKGLSFGELNGWTFFVSNQIGSMGELYVGTLNKLKVLYDPSAAVIV